VLSLHKDREINRIIKGEKIKKYLVLKRVKNKSLVNNFKASEKD
jgi:hypothetical protein